MRHLNYCIALFIIGTFVLLGVLDMPIVTVLGTTERAGKIRIVVNTTLAIMWAIVLIGIWIRNRGLAPTAVKQGRGKQLVVGHLLVFAGHLLVAGVLFVQVMAYLWILFLIVILGLYLAGILLVEISRDRRAASSAEA